MIKVYISMGNTRLIADSEEDSLDEFANNFGYKQFKNVFSYSSTEVGPQWYPVGDAYIDLRKAEYFYEYRKEEEK